MILNSAAESRGSQHASGGTNEPVQPAHGARVHSWTGVLTSPSPSANLAGRPEKFSG